MRSDPSRHRAPSMLSRRGFIQAATAASIAPATLAQSAGIRLQKLHCCEIRVADVGRSTEFYQELFGMRVQARTGDSLSLAVGDGPQYLGIRPLLGDESPAIAHIGYSVEDYDPERLLDGLADAGFQRISAPPRITPGSEHVMQAWLQTDRGEPEVFFADPQGLIVQLVDPAHCGSGGCLPRNAAPQGLLNLSELNHFTVFLGDGTAANDFYAELFGLSVQSYQGPQSPVLGVGDGYQFVMYAGFGRGQTPANIHHGCFNMHDFDVDQVLETLTDFGLTDRGNGGTVPLVHYISLRMPERGGAEGGTPELYFTDPDGILMQLQDVSYCGGGGYLGSQCLTADLG